MEDPGKHIFRGKKSAYIPKAKHRTDPWPTTTRPVAREGCIDIIRDAMVAKPNRTIRKDDNATR